MKLLLLKAALSQPKSALRTILFRFSAEKARLPPICNDVNSFFLISVLFCNFFIAATMAGGPGAVI
jgi:hypothetical protein